MSQKENVVVENEEKNDLPTDISEILNFLTDFLCEKQKSNNSNPQNNVPLESVSKYDSGFDTDSTVRDQKTLREGFFHNKADRETIILFEKCLEDLLDFLRTIHIDTYTDGTLKKFLKTVFITVEYLDEQESVHYKEICESFFKYLLTLPEDENEIHFNFKLEICNRFSNIKCVQAIITTLLIRKIEAFIKNLKRKKFDSALVFVYAYELNCCGAFLILLHKIRAQFKKEKLSTENEAKLFQFLKDFNDTNNFNYLSYWLYKIVKLL